MKKESKKTIFYFASIYIFIDAIVSLFLVSIKLFNNLFSSEDAFDNIDYIIYITSMVLLFCVIIGNYHLFSKRFKGKYIIINLLYLLPQLFSFHISNTYYNVNFGIFFSLIFGLYDYAGIHTAFYIWKVEFQYAEVDILDYQFIAINVVALFLFIINLKSMIKSRISLRSEENT
jgi:hypothetical protein